VLFKSWQPLRQSWQTLLKSWPQRNLLAKQLACFGLELCGSFICAESLACFGLKLLENRSCAETPLGQRNLLAKGWPAFV
jgi:hypothetical protein